MASVKTVKSLIRGGNILKRISMEKNKISQISDNLYLSKGTTYRLLNTLREMDFAVEDAISLNYENQYE